MTPITSDLGELAGPRMYPRRFSLATLLFVVSICCCLSAAAHWLGVGVVAGFLIAAVAFSALVVVWAAAYHIAPQATKYGTVIGLLGTMLLSILSMWLCQAREESRRTKSMEALRSFSREQAETRELHPD